MPRRMIGSCPGVPERRQRRTAGLLAERRLDEAERASSWWSRWARVKPISRRRTTVAGRVRGGGRGFQADREAGDDGQQREQTGQIRGAVAG